MDTRHKISISKIDIRELNKVDLNRYTHFIIPSFEGSGLDSQVEKLKEFVREGGTIIGYRYTSKWLKKNKFIDIEFLKKELIAKDISFENKDKFSGAQLLSLIHI